MPTKETPPYLSLSLSPMIENIRERTLRRRRRRRRKKKEVSECIHNKIFRVMNVNKQYTYLNHSINNINTNKIKNNKKKKKGSDCIHNNFFRVLHVSKEYPLVSMAYSELLYVCMILRLWRKWSWELKGVVLGWGREGKR